MIHLSFDTSTDILSLALFKDASIFIEYHISHPRQHAALLVPKILELFSQTPYTIKDVSSISVGIGPGSFTGSRIACSTAQGLSFSRSIPLCGVSSFQAMGAYVVLQKPLQEKVKIFLLFEDTFQKEVYGQVLSQNLLPVEGDEGKPFYMQQPEFLEQKAGFIEESSIVCGSKRLLESLKIPVSCYKVILDSFWEKPAYWIGKAFFILKEQKECAEAVPLYVRPSYVDPLFKKHSS